MAKSGKKINIYIDGREITDSCDTDVLFSGDIQKTDAAKWHSLVITAFFCDMVQVANGKYINANRYNKVLYCFDYTGVEFITN